MQKFEEPVQNLRGDIIALAPMLVMVAGTETPAVVFSDAEGQDAIDDLRTDRTGVVSFYAPNGRYDIYVMINGLRVGHKLDYLMHDPNDVVNNDVEQLEAALDADDGATRIGATWFGNAKAKVSALATSLGASLLGFIQAGAGAVLRSIQDELREKVTPKQFGAIADGVSHPLSERFGSLAAAQAVYPHAAALTDEIDWAAFQAAINFCAASGRAKMLTDNGDSVFIINKSLLIPKTMTCAILRGGSSKGSYIKTTGGTFPLLKVAGSYSDVSGFMWRPGGSGQTPILLYAANCHIHGNQFLPAVNLQGSAIQLDDVDPDTDPPQSVSGAYTHVIERNVIGLGGGSYAWVHAVEDVSTNGIQSCKLLKNTVTALTPFKISNGGANYYSGNQLQAATVGSGSGIDCGDGVVSEKIGYNYFEGFAYGVLLRSTSSTNPAASVSSLAHFDNCTNKVYSLGTYNYRFEDATGVNFFKGWKFTFTDVALLTINGLTGGAPIATFDDTNKAIKYGRLYSDLVTLNYNADGMTLTPTSGFMQVHGTGAPRANCVLGIAGLDKTFHLELVGMTWPVTILSTNVKFAGNATSVTFGNATGNIQAMTLKYMPTLSKWVEISRTTY
jgi:hypothetical protein